jgi:hypothetical protein
MHTQDSKDSFALIPAGRVAGDPEDCQRLSKAHSNGIGGNAREMPRSRAAFTDLGHKVRSGGGGAENRAKV